MNETISGIGETLKNNSFSSAVVEVGHFYVDPTHFEAQDNKQVHDLGIEIGSRVIQNLQQNEIYTLTMLFVDDFHTSRSISSEEMQMIVDGHLKEYNEKGFTPDQLVYETSLVTDAFALLDKLPKVKRKSTGSITMKQFGPNHDFLGQFRLVDSEGHPSCVLLDSALYKQKWESQNNEGICITVLPENYIEEQNRTKYLLKEAGILVPILNVYFDIHGTLSVDFDY